MLLSFCTGLALILALLSAARIHEYRCPWPINVLAIVVLLMPSAAALALEFELGPLVAWSILGAWVALELSLYRMFQAWHRNWLKS